MSGGEAVGMSRETSGGSGRPQTRTAHAHRTYYYARAMPTPCESTMRAYHASVPCRRGGGRGHDDLPPREVEGRLPRAQRAELPRAIHAAAGCRPGGACGALPRAQLCRLRLPLELRLLRQPGVGGRRRGVSHHAHGHVIHRPRPAGTAHAHAWHMYGTRTHAWHVHGTHTAMHTPPPFASQA